MSQPQGLNQQWVQVNGWALHMRCSQARQFEEKPALVMVHGLAVSSRYLIPTAERLAEDFQVYLPELPGVGLSDKPAQPMNVGQYAAALAEWMDAVGLKRAALLGNSLGCQIIAELALRAPGRVSRLVLVGPTVDPRARSLPLILTRALLDAAFEPPSLVAIALRDYFQSGLLRSLRTLQYTVADRPEQKYRRLRIPALVVRGSYDTVVPQDWAESVSRMLPAGQLAVIQGAGHGILYSHPDALALVTAAFLRGEQIPKPVCQYGVSLMKL